MREEFQVGVALLNMYRRKQLTDGLCGYDTIPWHDDHMSQAINGPDDTEGYNGVAVVSLSYGDSMPSAIIPSVKRHKLYLKDQTGGWKRWEDAKLKSSDRIVSRLHCS